MNLKMKLAQDIVLQIRPTGLITTFSVLKLIYSGLAYVQVRSLSVYRNPLAMRYVQFRQNNEPRHLGVQISEKSDIIDLNGVDTKIPNDLVQFLKGGPKIQEEAKRIVADGNCVIKRSDMEILAPITKPDKIICVGLNYKGHCDEQKKPYPEEPFFFNKFPSTIVAPEGCVVHPQNTKALDWEVELAVVIGKTCHNVSPSDAYDYVFGYTVAQDITARDWQTPKKNNGQWLFAKSMDTFCPLGPVVIDKEDMADPHQLTISCSLNGVVKQSSNTSDLIHRIDHIISYLSKLPKHVILLLANYWMSHAIYIMTYSLINNKHWCVTLLPGDLILTGTPAGVGVFRNPREFLQPGDVLESEISGIGKLRNTIVGPK